MSWDDLVARFNDTHGRGDVDGQIAVARQLLSLAQQAGHPEAEVAVLLSLANAYQEKADFRRAHSHRLAAAEVAGRPGVVIGPALRAQLEGDLGRSFLETRDWARGEEHTRRALRLLDGTEAGPQRDGRRAVFELNLALALAGKGDTTAARRLAADVLRVGERLGNHYILGLQHLNLGLWLLADLRLNESAEYLRRAIAHGRAGGDRATVMKAQQALGEVLRKARAVTGVLGYSADAERELLESAALARELGNPLMEAAAVRELAELYESRRQPDRAAGQYRTAQDLLEQVRAGLGYEAFQASFFQALEPTYERVTEFHLRGNRPADAFLTAERLRSRLLLAQLGRRRANARSWRPEDREQLAGILGRYGREVLRRCGGGGRVRDITIGVKVDPTAEPDDPEPLADARREFLELYEARGVYRADWHPGQVPEVAGADRVRDRLADDEALISYLVTAAGTVAFVVTRDGLHFQHLPYGRDRLAADVDAVGRAMARLQEHVLAGRPAGRRPDGSWPDGVGGPLGDLHRTLEKLYALLVVPLLPVVDGKPHWVIVPHGPLHRLPWAALRPGDGYLVERRSLSLLPSASTAVALGPAAAAAGGDAVFFADPDPDHPCLRLAGARREADAGRGAFAAGPPPFVGPAATKQAFLDRAASAGVIHFACHHFFDATAPLLSFLKLAGDDRLHAFEVADLRLPARLVALSACQSGLSRVATGDEQIGLVRAFLAAGVRSVVSTLWSIEDESAAAFFADFYSAHRDLGVARGLARAQRRLLADPAHALPYFWAAYGVTGDWR